MRYLVYFLLFLIISGVLLLGPWSRQPIENDDNAPSFFGEISE